MEIVGQNRSLKGTAGLSSYRIVQSSHCIHASRKTAILNNKKPLHAVLNLCGKGDDTWKKTFFWTPIVRILSQQINFLTVYLTHLTASLQLNWICKIKLL